MSATNQESDLELDRRLEQLSLLMQQGMGRSTGAGKLGPAAAEQRSSRPPKRDEELSSVAMSLDEDDPLHPAPAGDRAKFLPRAPRCLEEAGLTESTVEALILKFLLNVGKTSGAEISHQLALPFTVIEKILGWLKAKQLVTFKGAARLNDYVYVLTERGVDRARQHARRCTYFGAAPVALDQYVAGVKAQSLQNRCPKLEDIRRAFADMCLSEEMIRRVGRAVTLGKGLFLYGASGNGKTCIAERVTKAYGGCVWIPRTISA